MSNSCKPCGAGSGSLQSVLVPPTLSIWRLPTATHDADMRLPAGESAARVHTNPGRLRM
jgi:hypothetical protein